LELDDQISNPRGEPVCIPLLSLSDFRTSVYFGESSHPYFFELSTGTVLLVPTSRPLVETNPPCSNASMSAFTLFAIGSFGSLRVNIGSFFLAPTCVPFLVQ